MDIAQGINDFCKNFYSSLNRDGIELVERVEEGSSIEILKYKADIVFFLEDVIKFDNIGVAETSV